MELIFDKIYTILISVLLIRKLSMVSSSAIVMNLSGKPRMENPNKEIVKLQSIHINTYIVLLVATLISYFFLSASRRVSHTAGQTEGT